VTDEVLARQTARSPTRPKTLVATPAELAAAREARGMSQVDISHRIKLQIRQVNALEQGHWEALPGRAFVRGALRSYGRLLDVDVAPLLETIGGFAEPAPVLGSQPLDATLSRQSGRGFDGGGHGGRLAWVIACLAGVVGLVLYFGSDQDSARFRSWLPSSETRSGVPVDPAPPEPSSDAVASSAPTPADAASQAASSAAGVAGGPPGSTAPGVPGVAGVPGASGQPGPAVGAPLSGAGPGDSALVPPAPVAGTGGGIAAGAERASAGAAGSSNPAGAEGAAASGEASKLMQFKAREDSWVEVRQADGSALHNGLVKAGSSVEVKGGVPPFRLVIGNASGLELTYGGKAQDLAPHIRAHNIAKLQLP
jgi:cytoskeleton protein RodZ